MHALKERDIPFVIYSGFARIEGVCQEGPLVSKPADPADLVRTLENLLRAPDFKLSF